MNRIGTIARQEFRMTAANRGFVITTILGPIVIVALGVLPTLIAMSAHPGPNGATVAVVSSDPGFLQSAEGAAKHADVTLVAAPSLESVSGRILSGAVNGALVVPAGWANPDSTDAFTYYSKTGADIAVSDAMNQIVGDVVVDRRLAAAGLDPSTVQRLTARPQVSLAKLQSSGTSSAGQSPASIFLTAFAFIMMVYITVVMYGQMIARSVLTEKSSKTVEIMLSSVRPSDLLFGKIFGKGLAGLLQYAIWICAAVLLTKLLGPVLHVQVPAALSVGNFGLLALFFLLAYFLYAAGYAAIGSGADDEQHLAQLSLPLLFFLIIPLLVISTLITAPNSGIIVALSLFPMTAPIVMLVRAMIADPPVWQLLLSVAILVVTIVGMIYLSARIFRVGILMTGKRFSFREILRWIRG